PALVYGDLVGLPRPPVPRARVGVRWVKPWTDVVAAQRAGIPPARWLSWALSCEAKSGIAWGDPFPLIGAVVSRWLPLPGSARPLPRSNGRHPSLYGSGPESASRL